MVEIDMDDFEKKLKIALEGIKLDIVNALQDNLHDGVDPTGETSWKRRGLFTGALRASIGRMSKVQGNEVKIGMVDYGRYLEYGIPHTVEDMEQLRDWVRLKLFQNKKVKDSTIDKATQTIANNIKERGPRPFPFIRHTFNAELMPIIEKNLQEAFKA